MWKEFCDFAALGSILLRWERSFVVRTPMTSQPFRYFQLKVMDTLARIFPEGSDLDTIFWSYDDWREARERVFAARAKKLAASKISPPKI
jgi:hypothetical protein